MQHHAPVFRYLRLFDVEFISNQSKMNSRHITRYEIPTGTSPAVDPSIFVPRLLHGETTQAFWTASYASHQTRRYGLGPYSISKVHLEQLL
jgi:hypothetical protein